MTLKVDVLFNTEMKVKYYSLLVLVILNRREKKLNFFFSRLKIPYNLNSVFAIEFRYDKMRSSEKHQSIGEEFFNNNEIGKLHLSRCLLKSWNKTHLEIYGVCLVLLVHSILYVLVSYSHISAHPSFQK